MIKRSRIWWVVLAAVVAGLTGCSSPSAGGGGFEGETLALSGSALAAGKPLARASLAFVDLRTQTVMSQTETDTAGGFHMLLPAGAVGHLELESGDTALCRRFVQLAAAVSVTLDARPPVTWHARALEANTPVIGAQVQVVGAAQGTSTDQNGRFTIVRSRQAREWIVVTLPNGTRRELCLPPLTDSLLIVPSLPFLLLDDFEGSDTRTALGHVLGAGDWFALTDSLNGGTGKAYPAGVISDFRKAYSGTDAYVGTSLSVRFAVDPSQYFHYGQLVATFTNAPWWADLSKLDSVVFWAKGSGTMRWEFATQISLEPSDDSYGRFGAELGIPANWTRMVVRKADLVAPTGSRPANQNMPWSTAAIQTRSLIIMVTNSATLQLDNVQLYGPGLVDLIPQP